jgi:hypothetical protein
LLTFMFLKCIAYDKLQGIPFEMQQCFFTNHLAFSPIISQKDSISTYAFPSTFSSAYSIIVPLQMCSVIRILNYITIVEILYQHSL